MSNHLKQLALIFCQKQEFFVPGLWYNRHHLLRRTLVLTIWFQQCIKVC